MNTPLVFNICVEGILTFLRFVSSSLLILHEHTTSRPTHLNAIQTEQ